MLQSGPSSTIVQYDGIWYATSPSEEANKVTTNEILQHFELDCKIKVDESVSQLSQWKDVCTEFVNMSTDFVSIQYVDTTREFHINGMKNEVSGAKGKIDKALTLLKRTGCIATRITNEVSTRYKEFLK